MSSNLRYLTSEERHALLLRLAKESQFNAKELAVRLGISLRQLQRVFERDYRSTPQTWLNDIRMQTALELLKDSDQVKEVAYSLGFKQFSHFSRDFKRFHGYQPSALLRNVNILKLRAARHELILAFLLVVLASAFSQRDKGTEGSNLMRVLISRESQLAEILEAWGQTLGGCLLDFVKDDEQAAKRTMTVSFDLIIFAESRGKRCIFSTNRN